MAPPLTNLPPDGSARVSLAWADGTYEFRLAIGEWRLLQRVSDAGPQELYRRFRHGTWRVDDLRETIRVGLIGGGMKPVDALKLVEEYIDARPLMESVQHCIAIIGQSLTGPPEDDPSGKTEAAKDRQSPSEQSSLSPLSTVPEPQ